MLELYLLDKIILFFWWHNDVQNCNVVQLLLILKISIQKCKVRVQTAQISVGDICKIATELASIPDFFNAGWAGNYSSCHWTWLLDILFHGWQSFGTQPS